MVQGGQAELDPLYEDSSNNNRGKFGQRPTLACPKLTYIIWQPQSPPTF